MHSAQAVMGLGRRATFGTKASPNRVEARGSFRRSVACACTIHTDGGIAVRGFTIDISGSGAKIRAVEAVSFGERIKLRVPLKGINVYARVVWTEGTIAGVQFL